MVFRFKPINKTTNTDSPWSQPIGDKLISQIIRNQFKSTYSASYINKVEEKEEFKERARYVPKTAPYQRTIRWRSMQQIRDDERGGCAKSAVFNARNPFNYETLYSSSTRYGSNILHQQPAVGIVPQCNTFVYGLK
jgi:hypothetical protein